MENVKKDIRSVLFEIESLKEENERFKIDNANLQRRLNDQHGSPSGSIGKQDVQAALDIDFPNVLQDTETPLDVSPRPHSVITFSMHSQQPICLSAHLRAAIHLSIGRQGDLLLLFSSPLRS